MSDRTVLKALDREAALAGVVHRIIIMTDLGEGREGVAPQDLPDLAAFARGLINLKLVGIGTNFACLNKAWPSVAKLKALVGLYQKVDDGSMAYLSDPTAAACTCFSTASGVRRCWRSITGVSAKASFWVGIW